MIELKEFTCQLSNKLLFDKVDFTFDSNHIYTIYGDNGSGKTSLFNCLIGLNSDYKGKILINNQSIHDYSIKDLGHLISICSSSHALSELYVNELFNFSDIDLNQSLFNHFKIDHFLDQKLSKLSEGQRQWIYIARAILQDKSILLLDEPTAFLDQSHRTILIKILREYQSQGAKTILINTHDRDFEKFDSVNIVSLSQNKLL